MQKPLVGVVLGSRSDFNVMRRGLETLRVMGVPYLLDVISPNRAQDRLAKFAREAGECGLEVLIGCGGGNGQLPATLACHTNLPVIGVPIDSTPMRGEDALLGMVQMPPGTPVATVGINSAENAAILAAQILALKHARFREVLIHRRMQAIQKVEHHFSELKKEYPDLCDPTQTAPQRAPVTDVETEGGTEDITPEPPPEEETERIRPGAVLLEPPTPMSKAAAERLLSTPLPQEPLGTAATDSTRINPSLGDLRTPVLMTMLGQALAAAGSSGPQAPTDPPAAPVRTESVTPAEPMRRDLGAEPPAPPAPIALGPKPSAPAPKRQVDPIATALSTEETDAEDMRALSRPTPSRLVETRLFKVDQQEPDVNVLEHAMLVLLEGGLIAMPTDTVYGLAADGTNEDSVRRLMELKGYDPAKKSLAMLIGDASQLDSLVTAVPDALEKVLDEFWPGGLTVLFQRRPTVLPAVTDAASVGIRIPADPVALQLLMMMSRPLVVINTAQGGSPAATTAEEVMTRYDGRVECVLDAGSCKVAESSTVLSALISPFEILREGAVKREDLKRVLKEKLK